MDGSNNDHVFKAATNWTLAGGSLTDSISFDDGSISTAVDHVAKSSLLLLLPIHEDEPCEITITFAQEHELRQIYIRSSARVYEVYYTKNRRDDREYLCTVRCGIAIREEVLQIPLTELASPKNGVALVKDNGNGRMNEDDWIEVKSTDTSLLNNGKDQLGKQEFFEATAEINDAEPCISVTLRLLSLQDKRGALIDEVYVFADPVDQSDSENEEAIGTGNSSSSALMAMFMPTLMQLSRGNNVRKEQDIQLPDKFNSKNPETLRNSNGSDKMQQETNFSKADHIGVSSPVLVDNLAKRVDSATRVSEAEMKPGMSCNNLETILHQLVNKVSSIETILTRFEDQMLKPINSIDARLQLVESKVEELVKKSYESELLFETKVSNTDCLSSDTVKTPDTDELDRETNNTDDPKMEPCTSIDVPELSSTISEECDVVLSKNGLEKFVELGSEEKSISAESEISKDEVGHSFERRSLEEKPKRSVSINDALASALAGLLSSTSIMDRKYSKALVVTAPEFPNEDNMEIEEKPHSSTHPDKAEELGNTYTTLDTPTSPQKELGITLHIEDDSNGVSESFNDDDDDETVVSVRNDDLDEETVTSRTKADCHEPSNPETKLEKPNLTVLKSVLGFELTNSSIDFLTPVLDVEFKSEKKVVSDNNCFFEILLTTESKTVVDCNNEEAFDDRLVSVENEELIGPPTDTLSSLEMDHYETNEMHLQFNDALASALAGLLSSTSIMDRKYSKALVVTAPEFPNEDNMEIEEKPHSSAHPDKAEELGNTYTALDTPTSPQKELGITLHTKDDSNGVSESLNDGNDAETVVSVRNDDLDEQTVTSRTEPDCHEPGNPENELENSNVTMDCGVDDVLKSVLGFKQTNSSIDFLTPVLDVEFKSEKKVSDNNCFFETLLTTKSKTVVDCKNEEGFDDRLVSVEDEELIGPPTDTLSSLEMYHYETNEMHLQFNGELSTASLI